MFYNFGSLSPIRQKQMNAFNAFKAKYTFVGVTNCLAIGINQNVSKQFARSKKVKDKLGHKQFQKGPIKAKFSSINFLNN